MLQGVAVGVVCCSVCWYGRQGTGRVAVGVVCVQFCCRVLQLVLCAAVFPGTVDKEPVAVGVVCGQFCCRVLQLMLCVAVFPGTQRVLEEAVADARYNGVAVGVACCSAWVLLLV